MLTILQTISYAETDKSLNHYIQKLSDHPQVLKILAESESKREFSAYARSLPDPVLMLGVDNLPTDGASFDQYLPSSKTIGFKQQIPNGLVRKSQSDKQVQISKKKSLIAQFTKERLKGMLLSDLAKLNKVKKQQQFAKKQLAHYKDLENYFRGRLESGSGVYWRFSQVDVERSLIEQKLNNLNAERHEIESNLVRLVGELPDISVTKIPEAVWEDIDDLYPVSISKQDILKASHDVTTAEASYRPNYGLKALYKQRESGQNFDGQDWFSIQATISVPLWYKWNQEPKKRAALAQKSSAEQAYESTRLVWIKNMKTLESKKDAALKNVHLLKKKTKALKEMVAAAKRTYESGETSLDALLEAQISHLSIKSQLEEERFKRISLSAELNSYIEEK